MSDPLPRPLESSAPDIAGGLHTAPGPAISPTLAGSVGPLCLVGGAEWTEGCDFDADLWNSSGQAEVLILPTAAAYEHPARSVERAVAHFAQFGATARGLELLSRRDANTEAVAEEIRQSRFIYLSDGSALHLRSVLKDSPAWEALVTAWAEGAVVAGSAEGAMVLGDPMVDPRGGALTLGLGLFSGVALVPRANSWSHDTSHRTITLARGELRIVAVDDSTALIAERDGSWHVAGTGHVTVYADGHAVDLDALPAPASTA